jgi:hypothetical protein
VNEQKREQRPLLATAEQEFSVVVADLEMTEDMKVHMSSG